MTTSAKHLNPVWQAEHMTAVAALRRTLDSAARENARLHAELVAAASGLSDDSFALLLTHLGHDELGESAELLRRGLV